MYKIPSQPNSSTIISLFSLGVIGVLMIVNAIFLTPAVISVFFTNQQSQAKQLIETKVVEEAVKLIGQ